MNAVLRCATCLSEINRCNPKRNSEGGDYYEHRIAHYTES